MTVTSQRRPQTGDDPGAVFPAGAPCAPPKDGWKLGPTQNDPAIPKIATIVGAQFGTDWFAYPHGLPNAPGNKPTFELDGTEQVLVVAVTGNLSTATAAVRSVFSGNLCVVRTSVTAVQANRQATRLNQAIAPKWQQLGVITVGGAGSVTARMLSAGQSSPPVSQVQVIVDTAELEELLSTIPGPPVLVDAWIRPL